MFAQNVIKIKFMNKKKKEKSPKRKRYYGMAKIKNGAKFAWLSVENKHGWSLGFALNDHTAWVKNVRFATRQEVERALGKTKAVFIKLKYPLRSARGK